MDREAEIAILQRCLKLEAQGSTQMDVDCSYSPVRRYTDASRYDLEMANIFRRQSIPYVHSSQLSHTGDYLSIDTVHGPLLITRDEQGKAHAFFNVCRHRGTQLVEVGGGQASQFRCPYHAWTYANTGELIAIPHGDQCFPDIDKQQHGLVEIHCEERFGFLWITAEANSQMPAEITGDLQWLAPEKLAVFANDTRIWNANWKLIAEGGLESYHFRFAHKDTIAPFFMDNLSIYDQYGPHFRTVLPASNLSGLSRLPESEWSIRDNSHLVYALFPMTSLLVESDHIVWIHATPLAVDKTEITITSLVPRESLAVDAAITAHWQRNHEITLTTLNEDFVLAQKIQSGLGTGANKQLLFGRNEAALKKLNAIIDSCLPRTSRI